MPRLALIGMVAAAALAAPAAADAALYCVNAPPCLTGTTTNGLQTAIDLADDHDGADTIRVGAGKHVGPFIAMGPDPLTITGAGATETELEGPNDQPVMKVGSAVAIAKLRVQVTPGDDNAGLMLRGRATAVEVIESGPPDGSSVGVVLDQDAVFENGRIAMIDGGGIDASETGPGAVLRDSTVVSRDDDAVAVAGHLEVTRSTLASQEGRGLVSRFEVAQVQVTDTVVRTGDDVGLEVYRGAQMAARHVTVHSTGGGAVGVRVHGPASVPTVLYLTNSIVSGYPDSIVRFGGTVPGAGAANVFLSHSAWDGELPQIGHGTITMSANQPLQPSFFVAPLAFDPDLHLSGPSPLVDAGGPGLPSVDRDGVVHDVDGDGDGKPEPDIGAYELTSVPQPPPAPPAPVAPPVSAPSTAPLAPVAPRPRPTPPRRDRRAPKLRRLKVVRGVVRFELSEKATVRVRFTKRRGKPVTVTVKGRRGMNRVKLRRGARSVRLVATDAAGNRATALTKRL